MTSGPAPTRTLRRPWGRWAGLLARLVLGGVFVVAGALKVTDLEQSGAAVQAYRIFPPDLARLLGYALPPLEIALGVLLVLGLFTRFVAALSALLYVAFIAGVASVWVRGYSIDCGCFGGGGDLDPDGMDRRYTVEIVRDVALLALALLLVALRRTALSVDDLMLRPTRAADREDQGHEPDETNDQGRPRSAALD